MQAARWTKHTANWQTGNTTVKTIRKYVGLEPRIQHRLCPSGIENVIASFTTLIRFLLCRLFQASGTFSGYITGTVKLVFIVFFIFILLSGL